MNATAAAATRGNSRLLVISILSALALLALWFIARSALPYFEVSQAHYGPYFWSRRWGLVLHIAGGIIALTVGLVQLWLGLTSRVAALHRALGKLYVGVIAVASIAGFYLALTISGNAPYAAGLFLVRRLGDHDVHGSARHSSLVWTLLLLDASYILRRNSSRSTFISSCASSSARGR